MTRKCTENHSPGRPLTRGNMRPRVIRGLAMIWFAGTVSACIALSDNDALSIYAAPGKYDFLDCQSITNRLAGSTAREAQLKDLIGRANEAAGGAIVSAMVYQDDYNTVRADVRALRKAADDKKCSAQPAPGAR
jgi:hypothetical protein